MGTLALCNVGMSQDLGHSGFTRWATASNREPSPTYSPVLI